MSRFCWLLTVGMLLVLVPAAAAQTLIRGTVLDATTDAPLPAASIHIEGTYRGTITNADGAYELRLDDMPATLVVRYIGYETARVEVTSASLARQDVRLRPVTYELGEVVVTGENPAVLIMREVIERKKVWQAALETYRTEAYNRFTLATDTGIVSIIETFTEAYWDRERGMRETLKARRETANLDIEEALPAALFVTNLYDDDVEVGGYTLLGVTHPNALKHYDVRLVGTRYLDDQEVYDIAVTPKSKLQSAFVGQVAVLDSVYALIDVELRPNEAFLFPPPLERYDVTYRQQFSNFGGDFWLPVDFRADIVVKLNLVGLLAFPAMHIDQVSRFADYDVNVPVPDSLYEQDDYLRVDSSSVQRQDVLEEEGVAVPLSEAEQTAYAGIDSTMALEQAFAPTGPLARFIRVNAGDDDDEDDGSGIDLPFGIDFNPELWYNRVDAFHGGLEARVDLGDHAEVYGGGGYNTGLDDAEAWTYQGGIEVTFGTSTDVTLGAGYAARTALRYDTPLYNQFVNGVAVLLGGADYFDYYRSEGFALTASLGLEVEDIPASVSAGYRDEAHGVLAQTTSYDLLGRATRLRMNPPVEEGRLRAVSGRLVVGDDFNPLGLFGQNRLVLAVEHSTPGGLNSDFDYTRYDLLADVRLPTFFRRRLIPNTLDVRVVAGTSSGDLPVQRFGTVDAALGVYTPFGGLRTLDGIPYEGDAYAAVFWEHNFRTLPFEVLGLRGCARRGFNVIVFGGHGRTWLADVKRASLAYAPRVPDAVHHELGLSLSGLFGILRLDLATRLDEPGVAVGLSAARIF